MTYEETIAELKSRIYYFKKWHSDGESDQIKKLEKRLQLIESMSPYEFDKIKTIAEVVFDLDQEEKCSKCKCGGR